VRKFSRVEAPAVWKDNEEKWNRQWVELLDRNVSASFTWYEAEGRSAREHALPFLKAQTSEHCSFCDGYPVSHVSVDTIEHFRPKCRGRFPDQAYSWGNLYFCCTRCQAHKGDCWVDDLLAPDDVEYSFQKYFEFDFTTGEMRPSSTATESEKARARETIRIYGLDSDERRRFRRESLRGWTRTKESERDLSAFAYRDYIDPIY